MVNMSNNSSEWKRRQIKGRRGSVRHGQLVERLEERRLLSGSLPPSVAIATNLYEVQPEDRPLVLSAAVNDPDAEAGDAPLSYAWDLDGDGAFDDALVESPVLTWADLQQLGYAVGVTKTISLRVTDAAGAAGVDTAELAVVAKAEVRGAAATEEGAAYSISLHYFGLDPLVRWNFDWGDGTFSTVNGDQTHATHV